MARFPITTVEATWAEPGGTNATLIFAGVK